MDRERVDAWLEAYRQAWEEADAHAIPGMFTQEATYRAHPLGIPHTGHDGIAAYWTRATAGQRDIRVRFGDPIVDGDRVAVEWWTTMHAGGDPVTLVGCLFLTFAADGRVRPSASTGTSPGSWSPHLPAGAASLHPPGRVLPTQGQVWLDPTQVPAVRPPSSAGAGPRAMSRPGG